MSSTVTASLALWLRRPPLERKIRVSNPACWFFSGSNHTSDLTTGTPVATLPGAWHYTIFIGSLLGLVGRMSVYCDWVR